MFDVSRGVQPARPGNHQSRARGLSCVPRQITGGLSSAGGRDLANQLHYPTASIWPRRQHVDDVCPVVASFVAVAHQSRGDRVAVSELPCTSATSVATAMEESGVLDMSNANSYMRTVRDESSSGANFDLGSVSC